tara:strand:- start:437 stop:697 length:261 start_codon:yes stop_codon:yes gene_type:complete
VNEELFSKIARLLKHYIELLDKNSMGDTHKVDAEAILDEFNTLNRDVLFVKHIEDEIIDKERKLVSEDLASDILNSKYCGGGSCDD